MPAASRKRVLVPEPSSPITPMATPSGALMSMAVMGGQLTFRNSTGIPIRITANRRCSELIQADGRESNGLGIGQGLVVNIAEHFISDGLGDRRALALLYPDRRPIRGHVGLERQRQIVADVF